MKSRPACTCPACLAVPDGPKEEKQPDCISYLGGMSAGILTKYHKKGIFSILQLSHLFRPRRRKRKLQATGRYPFEVKALAIREQKTYVLHKLQIPTSPVSIYLDMEGLPDEKFIYLIGGLIAQQGQADQTFSFWAENNLREMAIFDSLLDMLDQYPNATIYHFGSYEGKALKKREGFKGIEQRMVNLLSFLRTHVYPPIYSNGLKELGKFIGFSWSDPEAGGLKSIEWRQHWEQTGDETWKQKLIVYNLDDCIALQKVKEWLDGLAVTEFKRHSPYQFNSNPEFGENFNVISKAAYFDYQRSRIYFRDKGSPVKLKPQANQLGRGHVVWQPKKANEIIVIPPLNRCPHCGHKKLYHSAKMRTFRQTDLKFTTRGIRQWVREFQSGSGKCAKCRMKYNDSTVRMVHFGDNLFAWAVNLYVNYHISHELISRMLEEQFGIWANRLYFMKRKEKWFEQFGPEVDQLREIIRQSPVIHIDETQIKLSKDSGYVWVLATTHTVFYHFTLNRESGFLKEWLKDYPGIIVADFFPGYESLLFQRQKCLIHLIRDLNDELFKNPFDEEYKALVVAFGKLLRRIIATIDRYGLKKRHLAKHIKDTDSFYTQFVEVDHQSELSVKCAKRLRKHWAECWTFLRHDGVPWNNNNEEAAVKAFAQHRRGVNGRVNEKRLREYLNMLSLAQTCRYRNLSFLDVLRRKSQIIRLS
jgi:hypothetical protein